MGYLRIIAQKDAGDWGALETGPPLCVYRTRELAGPHGKRLCHSEGSCEQWNTE